MGSEMCIRDRGILLQDEMGSEEDSAVRVHIPYFGIIRIAREKQQAATTGASSSEAQLRLSSLTHLSAPLSTDFLSTNNTPNPLSFPFSDTAAPLEFTAPFTHQQQQQCQTAFSDAGLSLMPSPLMQGGHPGLAAGGEDWAFQGVDMAFFESVMRNVGGDV